MSYLMSEEGQRDSYFGKQGHTWEIIDGKAQFFPEVLELLHSDRTKFDQEHGAYNTFWMLMDDPMRLAWEPPLVEPVKQMYEWTIPYNHSPSQYGDIDPNIPDTPENIALLTIRELWAQVLPQLLLAESEEKFDEIWNQYLSDRDAAGFDIVHEYRNHRFQENLEKLGMK